MMIFFLVFRFLARPEISGEVEILLPVLSPAKDCSVKPKQLPINLQMINRSLL